MRGKEIIDFYKYQISKRISKLKINYNYIFNERFFKSRLFDSTSIIIYQIFYVAHVILVAKSS